LPFAKRHAGMTFRDFHLTVLQGHNGKNLPKIAAAELKGLGTKSLQPWMHRACGTLQVTGGKIRSLYA